MQQPPNGPSRPSDSGKPPAKGASLGRPGHKGFIPPRVNREKVQVTRPRPIAPIAMPPEPQVREVIAPPPELIGHAVETESAHQTVVEARTKPPAAMCRPILRYYGGGLLTGVLILAAAIFAGFWVHSFGAIDQAIYSTSTGEFYWIESYQGAIYFHTERDPRPVARQLDSWRFEFGDPWAKKDPPPALGGAAYRGVAFNQALVGGQNVRYTFISYWIVILALVIPAIWWLRNRKKLAARCRRVRCDGCGAILAPSLARCPACGIAAPTPEHES